MSGARMSVEWRAPGPVAAAFMADRTKVSLINGPVGSGKTTAASMKLIRLATEQAVSRSYQGLGPGGKRMPTRQFRVAVVRDTYRQLWRTTIPSWNQRLPKSVGQWTGGDGAPATHVIPFVLPDGTLVEFEAQFLAIGDQTVEDALRGYEVTGFYLNEMDLCAEEVFDNALLRLGRWPVTAEASPTWTGILGDMNAPELNKWAYERFFTKTADELAAQDIALFRQPSGLSAHAENLANLPPSYYQQMTRTAKDWVVQRMIKNIPGYSRAGKPVYPEYNDELHCGLGHNHPPRFDRNLPLTIGIDAGGSPAAAFLQRMPNGKWCVLKELTTDQGTGALRFADALARILAEDFPGCQTILAYADPSAAYGADKEAGEASWMEAVAERAKIRVLAAPTNAPLARWEAVRLPLTRLIDGEPGFHLSPSCKVLRAGFNAEYRFRKVTGTEDRYHEQAEKNDCSHVHDALQYALSGGGEDAEVRGRGETHRRQRDHAEHQTDWDPFSHGGGEPRRRARAW